MPRQAAGSVQTGIAQVEKIPTDQLARYFPGDQIAETLRQQFAPGEAGRINVKGLDPRVVKRQYTLAAKPLGWRLTWGPVTTDGMLPFRVSGMNQIGTTANGDGRHQNGQNVVRVARGRRPASAAV